MVFGNTPMCSLPFLKLPVFLVTCVAVLAVEILCDEQRKLKRKLYIVLKQRIADDNN